MKIYRFPIVLLAFLALSASSATANEESSIAAAVENGTEWLAIVDAGEYDESWRVSASLFQKRVPLPQWREMVTGIRPDLGAVVSRSRIKTKYVTRLPGAPDGQYVLVVFRSSFTNKQEALETLTLMWDIDDEWRVAGYFLK